MDTRSTKRDESVKLSEEELELLRQTLAKQEERLRKQGAALDRERAEIGKEREIENTRRDESRIHKDDNIRGLLSSFKDEVFRELSSLRRDMDKVRFHDPPLTPSDGQRLFE
ncbi:hypothetical protein ALC62_02640 [Cyphomyrmex costatus]|uniref:Uncharacterized protein n=1 Tax=Cyphomyrmex costatus TaxID=456900 RepID=A0A151IMZ8_9HYME|nr:hypothetical protein ALC62_02640 [Cyphomyrmex costatus]